MKTNYQRRNDELSVGGYMGRLSLIVAPVMISTLMYIHMPPSVQKKFEFLYSNAKDLEKKIDNEVSHKSDQNSSVNHAITRYK